jgi:hypothetical protein
VDQTTAEISHLGSRDTLEEISSLTGGRWYPSDATGLAITQAVTDARATYQIGFYPPAKNWDGKSHKLRVSSVRKGVQVLARKDYATGSIAAKTQENFARALSAPLDDPAIGLRVTVSASPVTPQATRFQIHIDPAELLMDAAGSLSAQVKLTFVVDDASGGTNVTATAPFTIIPAKGGIVLTQDRVLSSTARKVRIIVEDSRTGAIGTLTVPASDSLPRPQDGR